MSTRMPRPSLAALLAGAVAACGLLPALAGPAVAADPGFTSAGDLAALNTGLSCEPGGTARVILTANFGGEWDQVSASCGRVELDLAGHQLDVALVIVQNVVIFDSVGGGVLHSNVYVEDNSTMAVNSGRLVADGSWSTPISAGAGAELVVNGGSVEATASGDNAAIGGTYGFDDEDDEGEPDNHPGTDGMAVTVNAGSLTATGPADGRSAAIGGGGSASLGGGAGGEVTVTGGALTVSGGATAFGGGTGFPDGGFGHLTLSGGTVRLPSGDLVVPDSDPTGAEVVIGSDGLLAGASDHSSSAVVRGAGTIYNSGRIQMPLQNVVELGTVVAGNNYVVAFSDNRDGGAFHEPVQVLAPNLMAAAVDWPDDPSWAGHTFLGWNTESDGTGQTVTVHDHLPGSNVDGPAAVVRLYAQWLTPRPDMTATVKLTGRPLVGLTLGASVTTAGVVARRNTCLCDHATRPAGAAGRSATSAASPRRSTPSARQLVPASPGCSTSC